MSLITRRAFLERASMGTAGVFFTVRGLGTASGDGRSEPHMSFPTSPRDRIAIASYPFRAYIESPANSDRDRNLPGMDLTEFPSHVVSKFNIHNLEPHSRHFRSLEPEYLAHFREALEKANTKIVDIAVSANDSFYDANRSGRQKAVEFAKTWVNVAVAIGSPSIRTHILSAKNSSPNLQRTAESLREVTDYGAQKNVVIHLENDDLVSEDAFFIVKVIEEVDHPYLRALPDFCNSMLKGDPGFNDRALQAMFRHAFGICHIKDSEADDGGKMFKIDLQKSFAILKSSGFRGYCSMEFDAPGEPYGPTARLIEQTLQYLS
jgi:sugar phosphate isomerase/epimerase